MPENNQQNTLPDPEQAYGLLSTQIEQQAFFGKLAQHNIVPQTEKEAVDLMDMSAKLELALGPAGQEKAAQSNSLIGIAAASLNQALGNNPTVKSAAAQDRDRAIHNAAVNLAKNAEIYDSVLSLKQAEADEIAEHLGLNQ